MKPLMTPTQRWERAADAPLMVAAVAFLVAYAVPILRPDLNGGMQRTWQAVTWTTWALFVVDYLARLLLAESRRRFVAKHLLDLAIITLPFLRPLRLLRLALLLRVLNREASHNLRGKVAVYVAGGSALLAFCGALAVLDAERANPEANIVNFGDAAWWAVTTMTTVGYGDRYPTTGVGRLAAAALMVGGITLLGVVTATLASWLVEQVAVVEQQQTVALKSELDALNEKVDRLVSERESS